MASSKERLQKYLARCGHGSRRKAELLIEQGLVMVNGKAAKLGDSIIEGRDKVVLHGQKVTPPRPMTVMYHKTAGTISSTHDTHGRLTVMDMLPKRLIDAGVLPAGRLDLDTEGLMIFTNNGDLLHEITHPRYRCTKEYYVVLSRVPGDRVLSALRKGVFLPDVGKKTSPAVLNRLRRKRAGTATIHIQIQEGLKRQIRRMFSGQGIKVTYLKRISIGGLELGNLAAGKFRELSSMEIDLILSVSNENRPPQRQRSGGR